jgi:hypothetical protein
LDRRKERLFRRGNFFPPCDFPDLYRRNFDLGLSLAIGGERPVRFLRVMVNADDSFAQYFVAAFDAMAIVLSQQLQKFVTGFLPVAATECRPFDRELRADRLCAPHNDGGGRK